MLPRPSWTFHEKTSCLNIACAIMWEERGRLALLHASPVSISEHVPFATGGRTSFSLILDQGLARSFSAKGYTVNISGFAMEAIWPVL